MKRRFLVCGVAILVFALLASCSDSGGSVSGSQVGKSCLNPRAICSEVNASGGSWESVDLTGLSIRNSDLSAADFSSANLRGASFVNVNLKGAKFDNADLSGTKFMNVQADDAKFRTANLSGASAINSSNSYFVGADFSGANLSGATFGNNNWLDQAVFAGANMTRTQILYSSVIDAIFDDADFSGGHLQNLTIDGSSFKRTIMSAASLSAGTMIANRTNFAGAIGVQDTTIERMIGCGIVTPSGGILRPC